MQNNMQRYEEDSIALRELWEVVVKRKYVIVIVTGIITLLAVIYVFVKTPMYEAKALLKIGSYKVNTNNKNDTYFLANAQPLVTELKVVFIDKFKNIKNKKEEISSISVVKKENHFIKVKALAINNEKAIQEVKKLLTYIQVKHQKILDDIKAKKELKIYNIDANITQIKTNKVLLLDKNINSLKENINSFQKELVGLKKKIKSASPSFLVLLLVERKNLRESILKYKNSLMNAENKKSVLETITINKLNEDKALITSTLLPHNFKNTEVVGEILTNNHPVKPKKKLIVIIAFITGVMLSIFLTFFLEFISSTKKEESEC